MIEEIQTLITQLGTSVVTSQDTDNGHDLSELPSELGIETRPALREGCRVEAG